ncbi:hypothetical protein CC2G_002819 [Coprinopsis cinerea AmutBmut pab1-1]|nr:hypothetical protein CC2G_002819 [Coprinopsis cinerea AmutBmut pab1-1]
MSTRPKSNVQPTISPAEPRKSYRSLTAEELWGFKDITYTELLERREKVRITSSMRHSHPTPRPTLSSPAKPEAILPMPVSPPNPPHLSPSSLQAESQEQSFLTCIPEVWRQHWRENPPQTPPHWKDANGKGKEVFLNFGLFPSDNPEPEHLDEAPPPLMEAEPMSDGGLTAGPSANAPAPHVDTGFELPPNKRRALEHPITGRPTPIPINTLSTSLVMQPVDSYVPMRLQLLELEIKTLKGMAGVLEDHANSLRGLLEYN